MKWMTRILSLLEVCIIFSSPSFTDTYLADEEDVFESDFESTDEEAEAAQQTSDTQAGERLIRAEERKEKKVNSPRISSIRRVTIYYRQRKAASRELLLLLTPVRR
jgi:hypothetical protein